METTQTIQKQPQRVGTFTFGLLLVAVGAALLAHTLQPAVDIISIAQFAPVALITLGIEVLLYTRKPDAVMKIDWFSILSCVVILACIGTALVMPSLWQQYGPPYEAAVQRIQNRLETETLAAIKADAKANKAVVDASFNYWNRMVPADEMDAAFEAGNLDCYGYFTLNPSYADAEKFAADCLYIMDVCERAGIKIKEYDFDVQYAGRQWEEPVESFRVHLDRWALGKDAAEIARQVNSEWRYNNIVFDSPESLEDYRQNNRNPEAMDESEDVPAEIYYCDGMEFTDRDELKDYLFEKVVVRKNDPSSGYWVFGDMAITDKEGMTSFLFEQAVEKGFDVQLNENPDGSQLWILNEEQYTDPNEVWTVISGTEAKEGNNQKP